VCEIKGSRVRIRPLSHEDVIEMKNWGKHDDPLFKDYNFPNLTDDEILSWYKYRTSKKRTRCFSVLDEKNKVVGYISIRNIRKIMRTARLGIVFNPDVINKGYGSEAIMSVLDYYFHDMKMNTLYLDVAKFNKRAIRCYEKCGFKIVRQYQSKHSSLMGEVYEEGSALWNEEFFTIRNSIAYCKYYEMNIQKT